MYESLKQPVNYGGLTLKNPILFAPTTFGLPQEELAARRAKWVCPEPKIKTGYLARYAKLVSSADRGAILE
mgnify:CR=1 FL=1